MNLSIRRLTPDLAEAYVRFFDETPHDVDIDEHKCYCVTWRSDTSYAELSHWFPTREERRQRALQFVQDGHLQGYLAYLDEKIIGWCNANAECGLCLTYLSDFWPIVIPPGEERIKSVFCFVIAPEMQGKGVATKLLERVLEDAAEEGYSYVEAYAHEDASAPPHDFRGPLAMYERLGFERVAEREGKVVMRKVLH